MADSLAELEDALGLSAMASPTPLPTVTPTATSILAEIDAANAKPVSTDYSIAQAGFDIPAALATAGAGTIDVLSLPFTGLARALGADPETTRYFALTKELQKAKEEAAAELGVRPDTMPQEILSFVSPSPLSKAKLISQAGTGLASYLGMKGAEAVAPESQYAGLVGALAGPAVLTKSAKAVGPKLEEAGLGLQRRALGITKADYKNAKNAVIETVSGDFDTQLKESVNDLITNKTLGTSLDPSAMYAELQSAKNATEDAIQATLKSAETKIGPIPPPSFDNTIDYISKNIAADQVDKYVNTVIEFQDALRREGQGSLTYLNQQKKIIGENWKNSPQSDPGFWRTIYGDVKQHIEKYAPEVKQLNKEKQKLIIVEPIVTRNFKAAGGDYDIGVLRRLLDTTGGAGLAGGAIIGAATGNLERGLLGALALRALSTPTGQNIVGRGLRGTALLAKALGASGLDAGGALGRAGMAAAPAVQPTPASTPVQADVTTTDSLAELEDALSLYSPNAELAQQPATPTPTIRIGKQDVSIPVGENYADPKLVKAIVAIESSGNPNAVSEKQAKGLMQLMPGTARDMGVENVFDPTQNIEGGSKYIQKQLNKFKSLELALAAYNWGPKRVSDLVEILLARGQEPTWQNVKRLGVPDVTQKYVNDVIGKYRG